MPLQDLDVAYKPHTSPIPAAIKRRYAELGSTVFPTTPAEFAQFIAAETEKWGKVVKFAGLKAE